MKVCLVGSSGGHLTHLYMLKPFWKDKERFWVTFDKEDARSLLEGEKVYPCYYPTNRSLKALVKNTKIAWDVLHKEKPDLIVSCGAAVAVPFFYIGKMMGAKVVYIEVFDRIDKPTMLPYFSAESKIKYIYATILPYLFGVWFSVVMCIILFLTPAMMILKNKNIKIFIVLIILILDVNSYNGITTQSDQMLLYCVSVFLLLNLSYAVRGNGNEDMCSSTKSIYTRRYPTSCNYNFK